MTREPAGERPHRRRPRRRPLRALWRFGRRHPAPAPEPPAPVRPEVEDLADVLAAW